MSSVTGRISKIKQPRGGYIKPSDFKVMKFDDGLTLNSENIHPSIVGLAVDYLTRFVMGAAIDDAFKISIMGAYLINEENKARKMISRIKGLDDNSIYLACKVVGYDVCYRAGAEHYKSVQNIEPDVCTICNIRIMVNRCVTFWKEYGPITIDGFTFEGGYTSVINSGDGDFLTEETLWDLKVSKNPIKTAYTLQLLVYYIMGCHSIHNEFKKLNYLGMFNPRLNEAYKYEIAEIPMEIIVEVSVEVIGYNIPGYEKKVFNEDKSINNENNKTNNFNSDTWTWNDLTNRYGINKGKIINNFFVKGLPHYKKGNAYCFDRHQVINWEIRTKRIPNGRNHGIELPGYIEYKDFLRGELKIAKQNKNREQVQKYNEKLKEIGAASFDMMTLIAVILVIVFVLIILYIQFNKTHN